jgi:hypothetical protein
MIPLLLLLTLQAPAVQVTRYQVELRDDGQAGTVTVTADVRGIGRAEVPLPFDAPAALRILAPATGARVVHDAAAPRVELETADSLTRLQLAWQTPAGKHRLGLRNDTPLSMQQLQLIYHLAPGQVARNVAHTGPPDPQAATRLRLARDEAGRTIELSTPVLPPADALTLEFATQPARKSWIPLIVGVVLVLLLLLRRPAGPRTASPAS